MTRGGGHSGLGLRTIVAVGLTLTVLAAVLPALAAVLQIAERADGASATVEQPLLKIVLTTCVFSGLVTLGAVGLGWIGGTALRGGGRGLRIALLTPLALPAYAIFYAWWQAWPPDSALYAWAVRADAVSFLREATLVVGLVAWSWPVAAWCIAAIPGRPDDELLMAIDGAPWWRRLGRRAVHDAPGLALAAALVFVITFNNTTCFDLAGVFSVGNEIRARAALGANGAEIMQAAWPNLMLGAACAILLWTTLRRTPVRASESTAMAGWRSAPLTWLLILLTVAAPMTWFTVRAVRGETIRTFLDLYAADAAASVAIAAVSGLLAGAIMLSLLACRQGGRRLERTGDVAAWFWVAVFLAPGVVVASGLEAAFNRPFVDLVYRSPAVLVLAHLTRAGFVAALIAWFIARREASNHRDLRRLLPEPSTGVWFLQGGPRLAFGLAATIVAGFVLALGEIPITARVQPPGRLPLALSMLNDMHYQRPEAVMVTMIGMLGVGFLAALLIEFRRRPRVASVSVALIVLVVVIPGCRPADPSVLRPLEPEVLFGTIGTSPGQFSYPRCLAVDEARAALWIIDKTARVQRFDFDGEPIIHWMMPESENGKPTGVSVGPDGNIYVADTHYHRVIAYDETGTEVIRFGRYGEGPGEFIYPTSIAFGPDRRLYVAEYGGNDRIQVFDHAGTYLFEFGRQGAGPEEFDRPQSLRFGPDQKELFIADACNHRIVVVDPEGRRLRTFGEAGAGPGTLGYPYGLALLEDGSILVAEFGNSRLQHFDAEGRSLGQWGGMGFAEGQLRFPWAVDVAGEDVFLLDSGNNRVYRIEAP